MKVVIEVQDNDFKKNDLLRYDGNKFVGVSRSELVNIIELDIDELKKELADFKEQVNIKLKEHHEVLQVLTKEG